MLAKIPENLTAGDVILAVKFFNSKTETIKAVKNRGFKINGEIVDSMDEKIEQGDFLNCIFNFPSIAKDCFERNSLDTLVVKFGKNKFAIVKIIGNNIVVETSEL